MYYLACLYRIFLSSAHNCTGAQKTLGNLYGTFGQTTRTNGGQLGWSANSAPFQALYVGDTMALGRSMAQSA